MSMYQSASRPEESVTFPCTTASSTISSSSRSRSGNVAGAVMRARLLSGRGQDLVDQVDRRVRRLYVPADHRGIPRAQGPGTGHREGLPGPRDGDLVVVRR